MSGIAYGGYMASGFFSRWLSTYQRRRWWVRGVGDDIGVTEINAAPGNI